MRTGGPYNTYDVNSMYPNVVMARRYYCNVHDWISRRFLASKPKIVTGFWVSFGVFVWLMSTIILPLILSE